MAITNNARFIERDGVVVGINLGSSTDLDHKLGIDTLSDDFAVLAHPIVPEAQNAFVRANTGPLGLERISCRKYPDALVMRGKCEGAPAMLVLYNALCQNRFFEMHNNGYSIQKMAQECELPIGSDQALIAAWNNRSFAILARGEDAVQKLKVIMAAWEEKDLCLLLDGKPSPHFVPCLCFMLKSGFSKEEVDKLKEIDIDYQKLLQAANKTQVKNKLKFHNAEYYILEPQWKKALLPRQFETGYDVVFYLEPIGKDKFNKGWFTVEEIMQSLVGAGPIIVQEESAEALECSVCHSSLAWQDHDEKKGNLWSCEKCYSVFCEACFEAKHGKTALRTMISGESDETILCPHCYQQDKKES